MCRKQKLELFMANFACSLKVSELTKAASASAGGEERRGSSDSREAEAKPKEDPPSSSFLYPEELQGFTSASEIYSVRAPSYNHLLLKLAGKKWQLLL